MKCPNCEWENEKDAEFCEFCGARLKRKYNPDFKSIIIVCLAVVLCAGIGVYFVMKKDTVSKGNETTAVKVDETVEEEDTLEYCLKQIEKETDNPAYYIQAANYYYDNAQYNEAIDIINKGLDSDLEYQNTAQRVRLKNLLQKCYTALEYLNQDNSEYLDYVWILQHNTGATQFVLFDVGQSQPAMYYDLGDHYTVVCMTYDSYCIKPVDLQMSYIEGTTMIIRRFSSVTGEMYVELTNNEQIIYTAYYATDTYIGTVSDLASGVNYTCNNQNELADILSKSSYFVLKDGTVQLNDTYSTKEKVFNKYYEINSQALADLASGNYAPYLN